MRFLVDADLPRRTAPLIVALGYEAIDVRDVGLRCASDQDIAAYAQLHQLCLISGDFGFADIRNYPPQHYAGFIILQLPKHATEQIILDLVRDILSQKNLPNRFAGRLAIAKFGSMRFRPG